jgi:hypothetical protein
LQPESLLERAPAPATGWHKAGFKTLLARLFSFPAFLIAGLAVVTVFTVSNRFDDPDLWWQLKIGQIIATTHSIPTTDLFSFTAQGHPWTAHEWLAQLSMYGVYAAGGYRALMVWLCVCASLMAILVYVLCLIETGDELVSLLGALIAWLFATVGMAIRALVLGNLFLVMEMLFLELGRRRDRRWLWCLPPLFAVWANCHASYVFGLAVLGVYWICARVNWKCGLIVCDEKWDKRGRTTLGLMLFLCTGALCCNPVGIHLLIYPFNTVFRLFQQSSSVGAVQEWMPPDLSGGRPILMVAAVLVVLLLTMLRRSELRLRELLLVLMAFGLALQHVRMMVLFGIVTGPVVCRLLVPELRRGASRQHPIVNATMILASLAAIVWGFPTAASLEAQVRKESPVAAVDYIRQAHLPGPMLNAYEFGGYLIWALPQEKVFIDGRADVYDWAGVFAEYGRWATLSEDPNAMLDKYGVRLCILEKDAPLAQVIPHLTGWRKTYSDDVAVVFTR